jgi:hypothetical protein
MKIFSFFIVEYMYALVDDLVGNIGGDLWGILCGTCVVSCVVELRAVLQLFS